MTIRTMAALGAAADKVAVKAPGAIARADPMAVTVAMAAAVARKARVTPLTLKK